MLVSTAFSQPIDDGKPLEERHYPSPIEPELIDRIIKNVDPDVLDAISPKYVFFALSLSVCVISSHWFLYLFRTC